MVRILTSGWNTARTFQLERFPFHWKVDAQFFVLCPVGLGEEVGMGGGSMDGEHGLSAGSATAGLCGHGLRFSSSWWLMQVACPCHRVEAVLRNRTHPMPVGACL